MPLELFPPDLAAGDSPSDSTSLMLQVTVMRGGGTGRSRDVGLSKSLSSLLPLERKGGSLWGGGEPGKSMLGGDGRVGEGCCTVNVGIMRELVTALTGTSILSV